LTEQENINDHEQPVDENVEKTEQVVAEETPETAQESPETSDAPLKKAEVEEPTSATDEVVEDNVTEDLDTEVTVQESPEEAEVEEAIAATDEAEEDDTEEEDSDEETIVEEEEEVEEEVVLKIEKPARKEFDWNINKRGSNRYSKDQVEELGKLYDDTFISFEEHAIIKGIVSAITDSDVVLNIGFKSDGLVPRSEFRDHPDLKIGDEVDVYVESKENKKGFLVLSRKKAKLTRAWDRIVSAHQTDEIITGKVISKTKGGLIVDVFGLETFLPGSQIDVKPITDYDQYVGKTMEFKVVKVNEAIKNAVVSHKALIESDLENQRQEIIGKLEKGQVLEGTIKNITDFGAFIDLGGVDGLLYLTDISWGRINHPAEVLELNQKLNVVVLDFDDNKKRISLGLKQLNPHPWEALSEQYVVGMKVSGKIVNIEDYGAFLEIQPGVEGLIHVSEVSWSNQPTNSREFFTLGQEMEAIIVTIDREERKMSLSVKQLSEDPWKNVPEKYPVGSKQKGIVRNITPYGVFVELDDVIGGMVHVSDLSWTKRYNHPNEFTKVGEEMEVVILEIDAENRKMSLGHKQLEEDPWDTFENLFPIGSIHEATVIKREDKGAVVQLPYGIEAFAPTRHIKKEDGKLVEADETLPFKIIEFERDEKRIIVSHTRVMEDKKIDEKQKDTKEKKKAVKKASDTVKELNSKTEKSTLGELGVLSQLKEQMEESEKKKKK
jgi:small subunit ribosomal protein S1